MKKALLTLSLFVLIAAVAGYAALTSHNNQSAPMPDRARIQDSYNAAVAWVIHRESDLLDQANPAL